MTEYHVKKVLELKKAGFSSNIICEKLFITKQELAAIQIYLIVGGK